MRTSSYYLQLQNLVPENNNFVLIFLYFSAINDMPYIQENIDVSVFL